MLYLPLPLRGDSSTAGVLFVACCLLVVVLYVYQGADSDVEQLALTEQLFDAALGELGVVARGQPCLIVGDFNVEPTKKILAWLKEFWLGFGLIWILLGQWLAGFSLLPPVSVPGSRLVFVGEILRLVALLRLLFFAARFSLTGGLLLISLLGPILTVSGGLVRLLSLFSVLLCGLLLGCLLAIRVGVQSRWRFRGFGRFTMFGCSKWPGLMHFCWMSLYGWMMSLVLGWFLSGAAETALTDAYRLAGGLVPVSVWHCSVSGGQA